MGTAISLAVAALALAIWVYLIVGRGGGTLKTGRRVTFRRETPFSNLHLSLMDRMGVQVESFGDSSGRLPGLDNA